MSKYLVLFLLPLLVSPTQIRAYPSALTLTSDVAFADILADIPFFSIGLLAFGVFTFFFVMHRINRVTIYIHLSVLLAFLAAIFDLSQIVHRGYWNVTYRLDMSSVAALMILRELGHALSIGLRYLFFWAFTSEPPRGELPLIPIPDERRPNFISLESESAMHSGNWEHWRYFGLFIKWILLFMVTAVPVLQAVWRLVSEFRSFGPIYYVEESIQIALSIVFMLKLFANTIISPLMPRWKTLRDYSPVMMALLFGMGVAIGNVLCFQFSETTLGRFFQAVELYILILFVLISAFYKMPVRTSVVAELVRREVVAASSRNMEANIVGNRLSQFSMLQAPASLRYDNAMGAGTTSGRFAQTGRPSFTQRISSSSVFSSRIMSLRQGSGQFRQGVEGDEGDQRRLWNQDEAEGSPGGQRSFCASLEQTPTQTPVVEAKEDSGWKDPVLTSVVGDKQDVPEIAACPPSAIAIVNRESKHMPIPQIPETEDDASVYTVDLKSSFSKFVPTASVYTRSATDSPVYGLNGIIRNLQIGTVSTAPQSDISSARFSGLESLLRQQQELDKSIEGLRSFSPTSNRRSISRLQSGSLKSVFSLSNFPEPPFFTKSDSMTSKATVLDAVDEDTMSIPETIRGVSGNSENSLMVDDISFQLVPPRMPAALAEPPGRSQNPSVPTIARESLDSIFETPGSSRAVRSDSQGTRYDVTSFIGGLTAPGTNRNSPLSGITEKERSTDSDAESVAPATIAELTRVQVIEGRPSTEAIVPDNGLRNAYLSEANVAPPALFVTPAQVISPQETQRQLQPKTQAIRPLLMQGSLGLGKGRGLPSGPRGRLEISNPMPLSPSPRVLDERVAFQRPRPAPLMLQNSNDPRPVPTDAPGNRTYF